MCSWSGAVGPGMDLMPAAAKAVAEVGAVMAAIAFQAPLSVYRGGVGSAAATVVDGAPAIVYDPFFLNGMAGCDPIAARAVLAHEVGHHANLDPAFLRRHAHPWSDELAADWVCGLALRRFGVDMARTENAVACSFGTFSPGRPLHPGRLSRSRLEAVRSGWSAG